MGSPKRERQKQNRQQRIESEVTSTQRQQRNRKLLTFGIVAFVVAVVIAIVVLNDDSDDETTPLTTPTAPTDPDGADLDGADPDGADGTEPDGADPDAGNGDDEGAVAPEGECPEEDGSSPRATQFTATPPMCIDPEIQHRAVVTTDIGEFTIDLDSDAAPVTVNNFVVLARYGFYDEVGFHRVIPGFVVQGGDAVGNPPGSGNPGYQFEDELPDSVDDYIEGSVAMANSGPNTNGSQFFVWFGPTRLPAPDYSLFGQVTDGLDVVRQIEADGSPAGDPVVEHRIESIEIIIGDA